VISARLPFTEKGVFPIPVISYKTKEKIALFDCRLRAQYIGGNTNKCGDGYVRGEKRADTTVLRSKLGISGYRMWLACLQSPAGQPHSAILRDPDTFVLQTAVSPRLVHS
jgi:hypothetical protein